ncbi:uncharacterized protein LY89DRAFT_325509 [Mollisia scopiformis]|uniref:Uncharacterized protein n=1 Tax=Mollisia scopiformis TaxID=149040 RepID=A0A132B8K5_MOLSC|nr:uncharacterized protein LY89DRAFT_325509 [Mollisia scopiformis]KUJ08738.1 hypothetical protein LY89DRAFT_325509 [Mollisia scopiformis]
MSDNRWINYGPRHQRSDDTSLNSVLDARLYAGKKIEYIWDSGYNWNHVTTVLGRADASDGMKLLSGKGKPPPRRRPYSVGPNTCSAVDIDGINRRLDLYTLDMNAST